MKQYNNNNAALGLLNLDKAISPTVANRIDYIKRRFNLGST